MLASCAGRNSESVEIAVSANSARQTLGKRSDERGEPVRPNRRNLPCLTGMPTSTLQTPTYKPWAGGWEKRSRYCPASDPRAEREIDTIPQGEERTN